MTPKSVTAPDDPSPLDAQIGIGIGIGIEPAPSIRCSLPSASRRLCARRTDDYGVHQPLASVFPVVQPTEPKMMATRGSYIRSGALTPRSSSPLATTRRTASIK